MRDHIGSASRRQFERRLLEIVNSAPLPGGSVARATFELSIARASGPVPQAHNEVGNRGIGANDPPED